ncbi:MAG: ribonuclease D [Hyphomicrobiaceae bacterium]|nr:ribonuclease D [Hyphomicrobiaceae bacterium]
MIPLTSTDAVRQACQRMAAHPFVTVDTEFLRETTYYPRLCLIQVASPDEAILIDALAEGLDLAPFFELMANEAVLKVFHAARQDLEIMVNLSGKVPAPIFDTQVAAMVCGYGDQIAYDQLAQQIARARIDKTHRFTDWARRPLSEAQLDYALADVTHLRDIYQALAGQLEESGRTEWVKEEMAVLTNLSTYIVEPAEAWQRMKLRVRKPIELAVLQKLAEWRESEAQTRDVPRGRIAKDDLLFEVATHQPASVEALGRLRAVPRGWERSRSGEEVIACVKAALEIAREDLPRLPKPPRRAEGAPAVADLLKVLLKLVCEREGVASRVIATVDELELIAADDEADVPALKGWRRELFGNEALKLKAGKLAIAVSGRRSVVVPLDEAPSDA